MIIRIEKRVALLEVNRRIIGRDFVYGMSTLWSFMPDKMLNDYVV
jgi:hypothetical protein